MQIPVTPNIFLSPISRSEDEPAILTHLADPAIAAATVGIPFPYSADDFAAMMAKAEAAELDHGHPTYLAIRDANRLLIGAINFRMGSGALEVGYILGKPWWNRQTACQHAFKEWDGSVIFASSLVSNLASKRVLEKCGFKCEGRDQLDKDGSPVELGRLFCSEIISLKLHFEKSWSPKTKGAKTAWHPVGWDRASRRLQFNFRIINS